VSGLDRDILAERVMVVRRHQIVIDVAVAACVRWDLGARASYADAFRRLAAAGIIDQALAERLARAAGFRNVVAHAYDELDMRRVYRAASEGPRDLERLLAVLAARLEMVGGIDGPTVK